MEDVGVVLVGDKVHHELVAFGGVYLGDCGVEVGDIGINLKFDKGEVVDDFGIFSFFCVEFVKLSYCGFKELLVLVEAV